MSAWFLKHVNLNLTTHCSSSCQIAGLTTTGHDSGRNIFLLATGTRTYVCMIGVKEKIVFYCYSWVHTCMSIYSVLLQSTELYMCFVRAKYVHVCAI